MFPKTSEKNLKKNHMLTLFIKQIIIFNLTQLLTFLIFLNSSKRWDTSSDSNDAGNAD